MRFESIATENIILRRKIRSGAKFLSLIRKCLLRSNKDLEAWNFDRHTPIYLRVNCLFSVG